MQIHENVWTNESFHNTPEKIAKSKPKGTKGKQKGAKRCQKGAKGSQKRGTWRPNAAKSESRGDQNVLKNRVAEKVAKREKTYEP